MRFTEYLAEAAGQYGVVVSKRNNNNFEDIELYDIGLDDIAHDGHARDLFSGFVDVIRKHEAWNDVDSFLKQNSTKGKVLGQDYADNTGFVNTLYGPFNIDQLGQLSGTFEDMYEDDNGPFKDQENW